MTDLIMQEHFYAFCRYYNDELLSEAKAVPEVNLRNESEIMSNWNDTLGIDPSVWLLLHSDIKYKAMVVAAVGWIRGKDSVDLTYVQVGEDVYIRIGELFYNLNHPQGVKLLDDISFNSLSCSEEFFEVFLIDHPEECDYIAGYTIVNRYVLYPFEPNV